MRASTLAAATLTRWLSRSGTLPCGVVSHVQVELEIETTISRLVFLRTRYSADAPPDLPHRLTIVHGDAHTWNLLFPRSRTGPAFLIDWQQWHIDVGPRDLAFFMALQWYPNRRRELELVLLRHYYDCLLEQGLESYSFDEWWLDYRWCVIRNLTIPIIFWSRGMKPEGWWNRLEWALGAYLDLDCDELL
jgi:hypothetical protein